MDRDQIRSFILEIIRLIQQANLIDQKEMEEIISDVEFDFCNGR